MKSLAIAVAIVAASLSPAWADPPRALVLIAPSEKDDAQMIERALKERAPTLQVFSAAVANDPISGVAELRPLYRDMMFGRCASHGQKLAETLIDGHLPSTPRTRLLSELLLWEGACFLLAGNAKEAIDWFTLTRILDPEALPDAIFPPEVRRAFAQATPGPPMEVATRLAPSGSRLWLDGKPTNGPVKASPGIHYVVVERADRNL